MTSGHSDAVVSVVCVDMMSSNKTPAKGLSLVTQLRGKDLAICH